MGRCERTRNRVQSPPLFSGSGLPPCPHVSATRSHKSHSEVAAVILAAGKGTRMKSPKPKVLFEICGRSLLGHAIDSVRGVHARSIAIVVGHGRDEVRREFEGERDLSFVTQDPPRGTGDAVRVAMPSVPSSAELVLVTYGDMPCLAPATLNRLIEAKPRGGVALLTVTREKAHGFGRILRDPDGGFAGIREEKDCSSEERAIREVNVGVYAFDREVLARVLPRITANNAQREYYLTDAVLEIAKHAGLVRLVPLEDENEALGVNSLSELAMARSVWQERILEQHLANGVHVVDPETARIDVDVEIGVGTVIQPFTVIRKGCKIGSNCEVGPFAHLRGESVLEDGAKVGNYVEVKKSTLGKGVKAMHLAYLGDTTVGEGSNIGAGTITANYDGKAKWPTLIGARAFIGSGTVLVAPSTVGADAIVGAGAIVTRKKIPAGDVWVGVPARPLQPKAARPADSGSASAKPKVKATKTSRVTRGGSRAASRRSR